MRCRFHHVNTYHTKGLLYPVIFFFYFEEILYCLPLRFCHCTFPITVKKNASFSTPLPYLFYCFDNSHHSMYVSTWISLAINGVENLCIYLLVIAMSLFENKKYILLMNNLLFVFSSELWVSDIWSLISYCFPNTFSPVTVVFYFIICFTRTFYSSIRFYFFIFDLVPEILIWY